MSLTRDPIEPLTGAALRVLKGWRGQGIVAAVSGGSDSVALLRVLHALAGELGLRVSVAHLDHGTRGAAGAGDAAFVAELAASLGLPCELGRWEPASPAGFEAAARAARYQWLAEVAGRQGAGGVAVGHTCDDQAETILHRIIRGTGLHGLGGMPVERPLAEGVRLIRPLLDCQREALREGLLHLGQPWREDASNADTSRSRAWIRHELIPTLARRGRNPRVAEALVMLGRQARMAQGRVDPLAERLARAATRETGPGRLSLQIDLIQGLPPSVLAEVLRHAWRQAGWGEREMTARHWLRLAAAVDAGQAHFDTAAGLRIIREGQALHLKRSRSTVQPPPPEPAWVCIPGEATWGVVRLVVTESDAVSDQAGTETLDREGLEPYQTADGRPILWIRAPRAGDRFDPLGLKGHQQRVVDFLRGRRVPRIHRSLVPLVVDRQGIVWVVGHRIAHRARCTAQTRRFVHLAWMDA